MRMLRATPTTSDAIATGAAIDDNPGTAVIPEMTITDTFTGGQLLFLFSGALRVQSSGTFLSVALRADGVQVEQSVRTEIDTTGASNLDRIMALTQGLAGPTPGAHTYDITWRHSGITGTNLTALALKRSFVIMEFDA